MKSLVFIFAHPDDESFMCGGTIAAYAAAGWDIHLLCATGGDDGQTGIYGDISKAELREIRVSELQAAAKLLGIKSVKVYDYKDGKLASLTPGELEDVLYQDIVNLQPNVVVTFEPQGVSNHPDHIKLSRSATFAFQKYSFDLEKPKKRSARDIRGEKRAYHQGVAYEDIGSDLPRLYYACFPMSVSDYLIEQEAVPKESYGKPWGGIPDRHITTVIDIAQTADKKIEALAAHKSQEEDVLQLFRFHAHPLLQREYFVLRMNGITEVYMGKNDEVGSEL